MTSPSTYQQLLEDGKALYRSDQFSEARDVLRKAVAVGERDHGPDSGELIDALRWLAMAVSERDYDEPKAEELELHERALRIAVNSFGAEDRRTAGAYYDVGLDLWNLKRKDESLEHLRRSFQIATTVHGDGDHHFVRHVRSSLGTVLAEVGQFDEAVALLRREAEIADSEAHPVSKMIAHLFLGRAFLHAHRWIEAQRTLDTALHVAENLPDGGGPQAEQLRAWLEEARTGQKTGE